MARRILLALATIALAHLALVDIAAAQRGIPVNVESVPPGATVYLDTADGAALGTTPLSSVRIARGTHTLIFRLPNHEEARLTVSVRRRRETFRAVLRPLGAIEVSSASEGAVGAVVTVDGQPVPGGTLTSTAIRVENLAPGRHQVRVTREGYREFSQWVDVQGGQTVRVAVVLERVAPEIGQVLVSSDIPGSRILVNGEERGTTPAVIDLPPGNYSIEVRSDQEGTEPFTQQVLVQVGQRATVTARLRALVTTPTTGAIAIITDVAGAEVRINGQALPLGSYTRDGLQAGNYVVQVIAEGYQPFRREVQVTAGQTTSVDVQLTRQQGPPTRINIIVNVPGATVTIDGGDPRTAPYVENSPEAGTHTIVVRASGYSEQTFSCSTDASAGAGDSCDRQITLSPMAVALRVTLEQDIEETAYVSVDGEQVGQVPFEGRVPVGDHIIEVTAPGYETYRQQMIVEYGEGDIGIVARLRDSSEGAAAVATTHSALPITINHPMVDVSIGWPYLFELRLGIGLHELVDAGFAIRSMGRVTEFEGRARIGGRLVRQIAIGGQVRFGGGIGADSTVRAVDYGFGGMTDPGAELHQDTFVDATQLGTGMRGTSMQEFTYPVNTAFFSLEAMLSLLLEPIATVTFWVGVDVTSDEYAGHTRQQSGYLDFGPGGMANPICTEFTAPGTTRARLQCSRQDMARFRLGGAVEFVLSPNWNLWFVFEGIAAPAGPGVDHRRLLSAYISDVADIRIYPRLGMTFKF